MADIKEKVESELKGVKSMCETMENAIKMQIDKGLDNVDTHEMYEAVDIYKDLSEVKKNIIDGCYKMQIMEAMENAEYGEDYDERGEIRYYRGQPRDSRGRFESRRGGRRNYERMPIEYQGEMYDEMYPYDNYRDMDRNMGRMYYPERGGNSGSGGGSNMGGNRGGSGGESGSSSARRNYMENKGNGTQNEKMKELETYMGELSKEVTEMLGNASQGEKDMVKQKMQVLMTKF